MNRLRSLLLIVAGALLLGGCAMLRPTVQAASPDDPGPGVEIRPDAPPEYDVLVAIDHETRAENLEALAAYERALEKDPDSVYIHRRLAMSLLRAGHPGKALEHTERALELEPDDKRTRRLLG